MNRFTNSGKQSAINQISTLIRRRALLCVVIFFMFFAACIPGDLPTAQKPEVTPTNLPSTSTPIPATPTPVRYFVQEPETDFTVKQKEINTSDSAIKQKERMQRWLDYWIQFDDRPLIPGEEKITWEYIYDDKETPTEILILINVEDKAGNTNIYSLPISNGEYLDYPPQLSESQTEIETRFGPFEITAKQEGLWLSIHKGVPVRKNAEGIILERANWETGQWEKVEVLQMDKICIDWRKYESEGTLITLDDVESGRLTETAKEVAKKLGMETFPETVNTNGKLTLSKRGNDSRLLYIYKTSSEINETYQQYLNNPGSRPYRWLMFNKIKSSSSDEIFVLATQQRLNPDKSISYVHYVASTKLGNSYLYRIFVLNPFPFPYWSAKCSNGGSSICEFQGQEVFELMQKWKQSRSVPDELQNMTMIITDLVLK